MQLHDVFPFDIILLQFSAAKVRRSSFCAGDVYSLRNVIKLKMWIAQVEREREREKFKWKWVQTAYEIPWNNRNKEIEGGSKTILKLYK